jgi:hypothetical protein
MLDPRASFAMPAPRSIPEDPVLAEHRRDQLRDAAVATVGEDAPMASANGLDVRVSVVNDIVAIARTAGCDGNHAQIGAANDELGVARPPLVLRLGGGVVITRGNECPVDDPRPPTISIDRGVEQCCETRSQVRKDSMHLRLRDRERRSELADREMSSQRAARHDDPDTERPLPRATAPASLA